MNRCVPSRTDTAGPAAAAVLVSALALAASWAAYQPVRSEQASDAAITRLEAGSLDEAASLAEIAREREAVLPRGDALASRVEVVGGTRPSRRPHGNPERQDDEGQEEDDGDDVWLAECGRHPRSSRRAAS